MKKFMHWFCRRPRTTHSTSVARQFRPALEVLEDRFVPSTFSVTNVNDSGAGSLRQAILNANNHYLATHVNVLPQLAPSQTPADVIQFRIGSGVQRIKVLSPLPPLYDDVVVDGTTQPGYLGKPLIVLSGTPATVAAIGLDFAKPPGSYFGAASGVRGLVINHFGTGVEVMAGGDFVESCYIGTDASGSVAEPNDIGVEIVASANFYRKTYVSGNLISGNYSDGIFANGTTGYRTGWAGTYDNDIESNRIGTDALGLHALGNGGAGIHLQASDGNSVSYNTIDANYDGINVESSAENWIDYNIIGSNRSGANLGNYHDGVLLQSHPWDLQTYSKNAVGGPNSAGLIPDPRVPVPYYGGNVIAFNLHDGVEVRGVGMVGNPIRGNDIHDNGYLGIDLGYPPSFAPVLMFAGSGASTSVVFNLAGAAPYATYVVDFFANAPGTSGTVEGARYIGTTVVTLSPGTVPVFERWVGASAKGELITATVTDGSGNTTEFSASFVAQ
jgi:parallel beta-helix repeat protein